MNSRKKPCGKYLKKYCGKMKKSLDEKNSV
jgi:hypothetical protein